MDESSKERNLLQTPFWKHLTEKERDMIFQQSYIKLFKKGQLISSSDSSCMGIVFVIKGGIRVSLLSDEGREITLYRLSEDELRERLSELDASKPVYVICQSGLRSYIACRILAQHGFDCYNFSGGYRFYASVITEKQMGEYSYPCGMEK